MAPPYFMLFILLWIVAMFVTALFAILCIIFSALSASASKRFLASGRYRSYKTAWGNCIPALIFFIIICFTSLSTVITLIAFIAFTIDGSLGREAILSPASMFIVVSSILLIMALALGIRCFVWYGRASKLNTQLSALTVQPPFVPPVPVDVQSLSVCPYCGHVNDIVNRFCVNCGQPIK